MLTGQHRLSLTLAGIVVALAATRVARAATRLILTDDPCYLACPTLPPPPRPRVNEPRWFYLAAAGDSRTDGNFSDTVLLSSTDPTAGVPASHTFVESDHGAWGFVATFRTAGLKVLRATAVTAPLPPVEFRLTVLPAADLPDLRLTTFPVLGGEVRGITVGPDGNVWYSAGGGPSGLAPTTQGSVGKVSSDGIVTQFDPRAPFTGGIVTGSDGNLWFASAGDGMGTPGAIGRITPSGIVSLYQVPGARAAPQDVALGFDDNVWFTDVAGNIGRTTPAGEITMFPVPTPAAGPIRICRGPDQALWFTELGGRIGRVDMTGRITEIPLPLPTGGGRPWGIALGVENGLWFTESGASRVGLVRYGGIQEFSVPTGDGGYGIAVGKDGAIWFGASSGLVRLIPGDISHETVFQSFPLPPSQFVASITSDADGNLWVGGFGNVLRVALGDCSPSRRELCLGQRFRARVEWGAGALRGSGSPVALTPNVGAFWFFTPNNLELAVKIVDGRDVNGRFWIFGAGLTNVEYSLEITDTTTNTVWTHHSPQGQLASFADTNAFVP